MFKQDCMYTPRAPGGPPLVALRLGLGFFLAGFFGWGDCLGGGRSAGSSEDSSEDEALTAASSGIESESLKDE